VKTNKRMEETVRPRHWAGKRNFWVREKKMRTSGGTKRGRGMCSRPKTRKKNRTNNPNFEWEAKPQGL